MYALVSTRLQLVALRREGKPTKEAGYVFAPIQVLHVLPKECSSSTDLPLAISNPLSGDKLTPAFVRTVEGRDRQQVLAMAV